MSATFKEANQVRLQLKMKFSYFAWYSGCMVSPELDGYIVVVSVNQIDNQIRKLIAPVVNGVGVKTEGKCEKRRSAANVLSV